MKKYIIFIISTILFITLTACSTGNRDEQLQAEEPAAEQNETPAPETEDMDEEEQTEEQPALDEDAEEGVRTLVVYFSNTGNTKGIAEAISAYTDGDLFEIEAAVPYTEADLNYNDNNSRASKEQNDDTARPEIANTLENAGDYDIIFLGYPIWWGQAPKIIYTFAESYDFGGAVIIPFCTSGSSGIGTSADNLQRAAAADTNWLEGQRFSSSASDDDIRSWIDVVLSNLN